MLLAFTVSAADNGLADLCPAVWKLLFAEEKDPIFDDTPVGMNNYRIQLIIPMFTYLLPTSISTAL